MNTSAIPTHSRGRGRVATGIVAKLIAVALLSVPVTDVAAAAARLERARELGRPHLLTTEIADVVVRIHGGAMCTGTPITGTALVVTAAHCVLDRDGEVSDARTLVRDGVEYMAVSVLVDPEYHDSRRPSLDAAVLKMDKVIPGSSATLGDSFPADGPFTLVGQQPLDTDGSLLRGTRYDNRPQPKGTTGAVHINSAAAGCNHSASDLQITTAQVKVPCGLIQGASGGGLFVHDNGKPILVGIISTVAPDLTYNGVVPLASLRELLENPAQYTHAIPHGASAP